MFTDLDFADDASFLAEMMEVLVLGLTVMQEEAFTFGLQINSSKTKILQVHSSTSSSTVLVADGHVEVVDAFVYLGCLNYSSGGSSSHINDVALLLDRRLSGSLVSWSPISDRLLCARLVHKHGHLSVIVVHGGIGSSNWKKTLAYLLVLPGSRARIVRCGGRYDPQLVKRSSE